MSPTTESNDPETRDATTIVPHLRRYVNKLRPLPTFAYWKHQEFTIFSNRRLNFPGTDGIIYVTVNLKCECYVYTTGARPTEPGAVFYIVMVLGGDFNCTPFVKDFGLRVSPSDSTIVEAQLPGYSTRTDTGWRAIIDYLQAMQMFTNDGNSTETFNAEYLREYELKNFDQTGAIVNNRAQIRFRWVPGSAWDQPEEIYGLTVFRHTNRNNFPLLFDVTAWAAFLIGDGSEVTATKDIHLPFEV